jgi:hypothetical protein
MTTFRDPDKDKLKSQSVLKEQIKHNRTCSMDGCKNPLSVFEGPGSDLLCRECCLKLIEYGGVGRIDRLHTLHRSHICSKCGKDVKAEITRLYPGLEENNPELFNRLWRNRIIGDHIIRKADGGNDSAENIQSLCLDCNADKTIINEDYKRSTLQQLLLT